MDVAFLADLLHETAQHHDSQEKTYAQHDWWGWYAAELPPTNAGVRRGRLGGRRALRRRRQTCGVVS
jgi:hypothetical protein